MDSVACITMAILIAMVLSSGAWNRERKRTSRIDKAGSSPERRNRAGRRARRLLMGRRSSWMCPVGVKDAATACCRPLARPVCSARTPTMMRDLVRGRMSLGMGRGLAGGPAGGISMGGSGEALCPGGGDIMSGA